jgi:hypothetical protein
LVTPDLPSECGQTNPGPWLPLGVNYSLVYLFIYFNMNVDIFIFLLEKTCQTMMRVDVTY